MMSLSVGHKVQYGFFSVNYYNCSIVISEKIKIYFMRSVVLAARTAYKIVLPEFR